MLVEGGVQQRAVVVPTRDGEAEPEGQWEGWHLWRWFQEQAARERDGGWVPTDANTAFDSAHPSVLTGLGVKGLDSESQAHH